MDSYDPYVRLEQETVILQRKAVASRYALSRDLMEHAKFDAWQMAADQLMSTLKTYVMEQQLAPDVISVDLEKPWEADVTFTVKVPATWWQHLKKAKFPEWYRDRWPVRMTEVTASKHVTGTVRVQEEIRIERSLTYPDPSVKLPEAQWGRPVYVERVRPSWDWA
jgi:hypothetical protein